MAVYDSLAELRSAIRSDDRGRFLDAADTVRDAGLSVDAVEGSDPPVEELVDAGIIPPQAGPGTPASEQRQEMIDLLEQIRDSLGGGA